MQEGSRSTLNWQGKRSGPSGIRRISFRILPYIFRQSARIPERNPPDSSFPHGHRPSKHRGCGRLPETASVHGNGRSTLPLPPGSSSLPLLPTFPQTSKYSPIWRSRHSRTSPPPMRTFSHSQVFSTALRIFHSGFQPSSFRILVLSSKRNAASWGPASPSVLQVRASASGTSLFQNSQK